LVCQESDKDVIEARHFVVEKRDRKTLHEIIERVIEVETLNIYTRFEMRH